MEAHKVWFGLSFFGKRIFIEDLDYKSNHSFKQNWLVSVKARWTNIGKPLLQYQEILINHRISPTSRAFWYPGNIGNQNKSLATCANKLKKMNIRGFFLFVIRLSWNLMKKRYKDHGSSKVRWVRSASLNHSTSTSNKCVARENLRLCPASFYSVLVDGEITGVARWRMSCCKHPSYVARSETDWNTGTYLQNCCRGRGGGLRMQWQSK